MPQPATRAEGAKSHSVRVALWGSVEYGEARRRQLELVARRFRGESGDLIVVVEHPAVITLGRHAPADDILCDRAALARAGMSLVRSDRGGRATYHGPGQAVIYPIVAIAERGLGVKAWVALLEDALLETLMALGISGCRIEGQPGIWVDEPKANAAVDGGARSATASHAAKIASIGLRVTRGVSYHGVSINVTAQSKTGFAHIVTCGVRDQRVTSIEDEVARSAGNAAAGAAIAVADVASRFCDGLTTRLTETSSNT